MKLILILIVLIILLIFFLICPALRNHPDNKLMSGMLIAHRGLHSLTEDVPENSLPAFSLAVENGYTIEIDIHLTADGRVVVFHDDDLKRMCGVKGKIEKLTLAELKNLRLAGTSNKIPTLEECLAVVNSKVPLLIEYKCDGATCNHLCHAAERILKNYNGKYFVQSFYPPALLWYRRNRKDILRGQLSSGFKNKRHIKYKALSCLLFNFLSRPDFIAYEFKYPCNIFRLINVWFGALPVAWTFRKQKDMDKYGKYYKAHIFEKFIPKE